MTDKEALKLLASGSNATSMLTGAETAEDLVGRIKALSPEAALSVIFYYAIQEMGSLMDDEDYPETEIESLWRASEGLPLVHIDDVAKDDEDNRHG
jgi:hypothetical protein